MMRFKNAASATTPESAGASRIADVIAEREAIERRIAGGTVLTAFADTVRRHGDTEAYRWRENGVWCSLTYREVRDRVIDLALGLRALGLGPDEFAVIWSRNRPEASIADLAVMHAGGVPVFLYNTLAPDQAAYIAGHCEATVAIVENRDFLARLEAVRSRLPRLRKIVLIDGENTAGEDLLVEWDSALALGHAEHGRSPGMFDEMWRHIGPDNLATLVYTSGTTGPPKGVMLTHRNVRYSTEALLSVVPPAELADEGGIRTISYLPMAHVAGRLTDHWLPIIHPVTVAFCPDAAQLFSIAPQVRPTMLNGVPRVWEKLQTAMLSASAANPSAANPNAAGRKLLTMVGLDACKLAGSGAAPIGPQVLEFFQALGLPMVEAWGMTELSGAATISHPSQACNGTVGTACPGVELSIADDGEILVRGPMVMRGYYRDLAGTAEAVDNAGWLHTGDVGTLDAEGRLRIVDRKKELIITSGGKNISPAAIESLLQRHPLIGQACAIGDRRNYVTALLVLDGQAASAWARRHGLADASPAGLAAHPHLLTEVEHGVRAANEHLARVEHVRRFMLLPAEWTAATGELTPTLKRRRRFIADRYSSEIDRMYGPADAGVVDLL